MYVWYLFHHYNIKTTVVCLSVCHGRSAEAIQPERKPFNPSETLSFSLQSYSWTLHQGVHRHHSKDASSRLKEALLQSVE